MAHLLVGSEKRKRPPPAGLQDFGDLFRGLPREIKVWMSHGDEARELPTGFELVARSANAVAAIQDPKRRFWAAQFHPEVHHTPLGTQILKNFVFGICGATANWTPQRFIDEKMPGHLPHGLEDPLVVNATGYHLDFHHPFTSLLEIHHAALFPFQRADRNPRLKSIACTHRYYKAFSNIQKDKARREFKRAAIRTQSRFAHEQYSR